MSSVTDSKRLWRLEGRELWNEKTGELRLLHNTPSAIKVALMSERTFVKKCKEAFNTGVWENA